MNPLLMRRILAKGVIGSSLCTGAWFLFVEPLERRLLAVHEEEAAVRSAFAASPPADAAGLRASFDRSKEVAARSVRAADELQLYAELLESAAEAGLDVDQLVKRNIIPPSSSLPAETIIVPARCLGFEMNVQGSFDAIFAFTARLESPDSYSRVERMTLAPTGAGDDPRVSATIETIHWSFDPSSTVTAIEAAIAATANEEAIP